MNERTKERTNEQTNEQTNKRMNEIKGHILYEVQILISLLVIFTTICCFLFTFNHESHFGKLYNIWKNANFCTLGAKYSYVCNNHQPLPKNIWNVFVHSWIFNYTGICKKN